MTRRNGGQGRCAACGEAMRLQPGLTRCPDCRLETKVCPGCGEKFTTDRGTTFCSVVCHLRRFHTDPAHQSRAGSVSGAKRREASLAYTGAVLPTRSRAY